MIMWVAAALVVGFILGAIEGRAGIARAQEIAAAADTEAQAIRAATAHAVAAVKIHIEEGNETLAREWANVVSTLRSAL